MVSIRELGAAIATAPVDSVRLLTAQAGPAQGCAHARGPPLPMRLCCTNGGLWLGVAPPKKTVRMGGARRCATSAWPTL